MRPALCCVLATSILAIPAAAHATQMDFFDLDNGFVTFTLPASPLDPAPSTRGAGFVLDDFSYTENGVSKVASFADFYSATEDLGGFDLFTGTVETLNLIGPALYGGTEADPTFVPGFYYLSPDDGSNGTLSISPVTTTPEPGSLALLGTGALGMLGVLRRRLI